LIAQPPTEVEKKRTRLDRQIGSLIRSIDDIVWSNIRIYRLESDFKTRLISSMESEDEADLERLRQIGEIIAPDPIPEFDKMALSIAASPATLNVQIFRQQVAQRAGGLDPEFDIDEAEADRAFSIAKTVIQNRRSRPKNFYLVTSPERDNARLIALLGVDLELGEPRLMSFVKVGSQMYDYLTSNNTDSTMYNDMKSAVQEGNSLMLTNQMFILRDLADHNIVDRTTARATGIDENQHPWIVRSVSMGRPIREAWEPSSGDSGVASSDDDPWNLGGGGWDIGGGKQDITEGAAVPGAIEYPKEIVVGSDVVAAYYAYQMEDNKVTGTEWGLELLNHFDELNYPSIWGGRATVNAILRNMKIGAILPVPRLGGETMAESGVFDKPQRILGGYGLAFSGDFTAPMLNNSGLFNFHASYTFDEASTDKLALSRYLSPTDSTLGPATPKGDEAYLIRYAFQGYYSFGFYADNDATHLFRLKFGGGVYGVDTYERRQVFRSDVEVDTTAQLGKVGSESHGGVAGKIEYMKGGTDIPYGASFQYFDGSVLGSVWLQFVVGRSLDLKLQGKYFTPLFRDPRPWESNSLVVPSLEVKYHFGTP
jgi:hypothetical protein